MMYFNSMKITLRNNAIATEALEILKTRLADGFDCDQEYNDNPSMRMANDLVADGKTIKLPKNNGYYFPENAENVMCELLKYLAENLNGKTFSCIIENEGEEDFGEIEAQYKKGVLTTKATYFPRGYEECFYCEDCGETVVWMDEYDESETYICPECGEVLDLSEQKPKITENTWKIA